MDLNKVTLIGNLTRDPETKEVNGNKLAKFGLATNYSWKDRESGDKKEDVVFHNIVAWNGLGSTAAKYLKKGNKVFIEGRVNNRKWEDKKGDKRFSSEVIAKNMIMLSGKSATSDKAQKEAEVVEEEVDSNKVPF